LKIGELPDSIVYLEDGKVYLYSEAVIKIFKALGGPFKLILILYVIPKSGRDLIYKWIAKNRFRIFGRRETCFIPEVKMQARILD
jgi:predicted DCC family thiol-disulfide oxidoreductase YuxK